MSTNCRQFPTRRVIGGLLGLGAICNAVMMPLLSAPASAAPPTSAAGRQVSFPYSFQDNLGTQWDIQPNGAIGPGNADVFDAGGKLFINNNEYAPTAPTATLDGSRNELLLPQAALGGLQVTRRVGVDSRQGLCRFVELLTNPGPGAVHVQLHLNFQLGNTVQSSRNVGENKKTGKPLGVAIFDGTRAIAMLGAGHGAAVIPVYEPQLNTDQVNMTCDFDAPPHKTVALVHLAAIRPSVDDAAAFIEKLSDSEALHDLPGEIQKEIVNFRVRSSAFGEFDFIRNELLDTVELRGGDQCRGTLQDKTYSLTTPYGSIELPAEKVLAMFAVGDVRPTQLVVTREGEAFGGSLQSPVLHLLLSSGQVTPIPVASITRMGYRMPPDQSEEFKYTHPMLLLRSGDRIAVEVPPEPIPVATRYGNLLLKPASIAALAFQEEEQPVHRLLLTDGSRIAALVDKEALELRPLSTGDSKPLSFPAATVSRLQISPRVEEPGEMAPTLLTTTGDRLVGTLCGKIVVETAFDSIEVSAAEIRFVRHAGASPLDVQVTLWDDSSLSGRLKGDAADILLGCGSTLRVPSDLIAQYTQPAPQPPASILDDIRARVAELGADDATRADAAAAALRSMGAKISGPLRSLRDQQGKLAQNRIDKILSAVDGPSTKPAAAGAEGK